MGTSDPPVRAELQVRRPGCCHACGEYVYDSCGTPSGRWEVDLMTRYWADHERRCPGPTKEKPVPAGRFRKKPVEIDAGQYDGTYASVAAWLGALGYDPEDGDGSDGVPNMYEADGGLVIETLEGDMRADPGDWVIRGIKGEFYPVKPDIFAETYEAVDG